MTKKIFLGGPFKSYVDHKTNKMHDAHIKRFHDLILFFEERGYEVHNAHQREDWGKNFWSPDDCTKLDYEEIAKSDVFIAFPGSPASPGTHIEIGWASALKKKVILLLEEGQYYAHLVKGLHTVANVSYLYYKEPSDYLTTLEELFPSRVALV